MNLYWPFAELRYCPGVKRWFTVRLSSFTAKVTGTVKGELLTLAAVTVIVPLYVPAARPAILTERFVDEDAVPLVVSIVSQLASSLALQLRMPPVALFIVSF